MPTYNCVYVIISEFSDGKLKCYIKLTDINKVTIITVSFLIGGYYFYLLKEHSY